MAKATTPEATMPSITAKRSVFSRRRFFAALMARWRWPLSGMGTGFELFYPSSLPAV